MYEKFGEFNDVKELNETARGFLVEGDLKSLREFATENGLDPEDVEDYIAGDLPELATEVSAAMGKLLAEEKEIETKKTPEKMPLKIIMEMTRLILTESEMPQAILKKGKRITEIYELMKKVARTQKRGSVGVACGTDRQLQEIIRTYYTRGKKEAEEVIKNLYK